MSSQANLSPTAVFNSLIGQGEPRKRIDPPLLKRVPRVPAASWSWIRLALPAFESSGQTADSEAASDELCPSMVDMLKRLMALRPGYELLGPTDGDTAPFDLLDQIASLVSRLFPNREVAAPFGRLPLLGLSPRGPGLSAQAECRPVHEGSTQLSDVIDALLADIDKIAPLGYLGLQQLRSAASGQHGVRAAQAASFLLANPLLFDTLRSCAARIYGSRPNVQLGLTRRGLLLARRLAEGAGGSTDIGTTLRTLNAYFDGLAAKEGSKDAISADDLQPALADKVQTNRASPASTLASDPMVPSCVEAAVESISGHRPGAVDGQIKRLDLLCALRSVPLDAQELEVLAVMGRFEGSLWPVGGRQLYRSDFQSMALGLDMPDGGATTLELRWAMRKLLESPALLDRLDSARLIENQRSDLASGRSPNPVNADRQHLPAEGSFTREGFRALVDSHNNKASAPATPSSLHATRAGEGHSSGLGPVGGIGFDRQSGGDVSSAGRGRGHGHGPQGPWRAYGAANHFSANLIQAMLSHQRNTGGSEESIASLLTFYLACQRPDSDDSL